MYKLFSSRYSISISWLCSLRFSWIHRHLESFFGLGSQTWRGGRTKCLPTTLQGKVCWWRTQATWECRRVWSLSSTRTLQSRSATIKRESVGNRFQEKEEGRGGVERRKESDMHQERGKKTYVGRKLGQLQKESRWKWAYVGEPYPLLLLRYQKRWPLQAYQTCSRYR